MTSELSAKSTTSATTTSGELSAMSAHRAEVERLLAEAVRDFSGARSERLKKAMMYSLFQKGAKRFRPTLALLAAKAQAQAQEQAPVQRQAQAQTQSASSQRLAPEIVEQLAPFCAALECVHTYSLIHDDLPAMDDDDLRRGQPTNHKQFDEATAILAGDALLTDAFFIIASAHKGISSVGIELVQILSEAAGSQGMVAGQMLDLSNEASKLKLQEIQEIHELKTGALIRAAVEGGAVCAGAQADDRKRAREFGSVLGLAFQVADDLLDHSDSEPEPINVTTVLGLDRTRVWLDELTRKGIQLLEPWGPAADPLRDLVRYNATRTL